MLHPSRDQINLLDVLAALGHPVRAQIVRALSSGEERFCGSIVPGVPKSTLTTHWRVLREAGVIYQRPEGRKQFITLRADDLNARFPGLLDLLMTAEL
ncbi:helix-turn-helix transcriptional regulator [Nonomuraea sp. NN258]|uniref:ArsR/SmtB family transcription factor n=1 Tax=Nonomuraea antri TaxID=2730852 RepID=UPI0015694BA6|nr:helix-turn-helix domain-containing protein [Nonomuraea antri]NRQ31004.1 helix-turn-helix transcriptional regulator [Nonomuraea antri]